MFSKMQRRNGCCSEFQCLCLILMFTHECILIETVEKNFAKTALIKIHTVFAVRIEFCLSVSTEVLVWMFCTNLLCKTVRCQPWNTCVCLISNKMHVIHGLFYYYHFLSGEILQCRLSIMHTICIV